MTLGHIVRSPLAAVRRHLNEPSTRSAIVAGLVAFAIYEVSREPGQQLHDQYVRLADSILAGRLDIIDPPDWMELVTFEGRAYSHQGVLPALLLVPFVFVFGPDFNLRHFAALLGGGVSMAVWSLAGRIGLQGARKVAGWAFPVLGTTIWFEAKAGSTWGVAALASVLFLTLALNEYFGPQRLWLIGLFVGTAAMARPPALLAALGFALALRSPSKIIRMAMGVVGPIVLVAGYNFLRFGTLFDRSQEIHYLADSYRHHRPPGQFSVAHLPHNLYSWFLLGPRFQSSFPWIVPTIMGTALTLTSPAWLTGLAAKRERWLWLGAVCVVGPAALHYANGFTQFGIRYLLDAVPFLSALIFLALRDDRGHVYLPLLAASIAFNAYGVAYTTVFGLQP